ncbi:MAG TPA: LysR substrate-binding domain-containing protein, partial [Hyphomicrobiales bacterium]|nr:LysR substrate-binding domain-containing protein [Hyphomicrobiales bacterium]
ALFGDPLLVRAGRGLVLTRGAEDLIGPVREILAHIEQTLVERPRFDPTRDVRAFSISASDYATLVLLRPFVQRLAAEAPAVTVHLLPRSPDVGQVLRSDHADLVIEPRELFADAKFPSAPLFSDRWLCAVDAANPEVRGRRISWERYLALPHLVYSIGPDRQLNLADQHLGRLGVRRRIEVTVESFLLVPFLLAGTPLVSVVLARTVGLLSAATTIRTLEPPMKLPDIHEAMFWHPRHTTDPGHRWLRERLAAIAAGLPG